MPNKVNPIPPGFHSLTPYLHLTGAAEAIDFYKRAFGATERFRMPTPQGTIGHAELVFGDSILMLADECSQAGNKSPTSLKGTTCTLTLYVPDVDTTFHQAVAAGATVIRPLENMFYGDRTAVIQDPFGHSWALMTHIEDVRPEEMQARAEAQFGKPSG